LGGDMGPRFGTLIWGVILELIPHAKLNKILVI
jgi:hypothetical protein